MSVLITGATGFIGKKIIERLVLRGDTDIRILTRNPKEDFPFPVKQYKWNADTKELPAEAVEGVDAVINLAGESIVDSRWSEEKKDKILSSRVNSSKLLVDRINTCINPPKKLISASAIGYYGDSGDDILTENSPSGDSFLSDVCIKWEEEIRKLEGTDTKFHIMRIGLVLDEKEGALSKAMAPFKFGIGAKLGNGKQYMSWVHIEDLVSQFLFVLDKDCQHETFNCVSPNPVTNKEFTKKLARALHKPAFFIVPRFALSLVLGEMSKVVTSSQRVMPSNLLQEGFSFKYTKIADAFNLLLPHASEGEEILETYQFIPVSIDKIFQFFSKAENLEAITPKTLNFKIVDKSTEDIQTGAIINYKLKLHGIPLKWKTRINSFIDGKEFTDEQIKGPYKKWIHSHKFYSVNGGTLMKDRIIYKFPMGNLGALVAGPFARRDLKKIFGYRFEVIKNKFGRSNP